MRTGERLGPAGDLPALHLDELVEGAVGGDGLAELRLALGDRGDLLGAQPAGVVDDVGPFGGESFELGGVDLDAAAQHLGGAGEPGEVGRGRASRPPRLGRLGDLVRPVGHADRTGAGDQAAVA